MKDLKVLAAESWCGMQRMRAAVHAHALRFRMKREEER